MNAMNSEPIMTPPQDRPVADWILSTALMVLRPVVTMDHEPDLPMYGIG